MDNYEIVEQLPKEGHNSSFVVTSIFDGKKYVMKMIECIDESASNKAFKEIQLLFKLKHPFISFPCDAFVTWDKSVSGMFVCTISPQYEQGDLLTFIKDKRSKKQLVDEKNVVLWFSELVAALTFLHNQAIPHRNLKPSNVYISQGIDVVLGDCGVNSVMADILMRTRQTKGAMDWMSPESVDKAFDTVSDIWSLGCIILELMTCGIWDTAEMAGHLSAIKHDQAALDQLLVEVAKHYSKDLVSVVASMLTPNTADRPTIQYIAELPFIKEKISMLMDVTKAKTVASTSNAHPLHSAADIDSVLHYLSENGSDASSAMAGLKELCQHTASTVLSPSSDDRWSIVTCLETHDEFSDIQLMGCQALAQLVSTAQQDDPIYHPRMCKVITKALKLHGDNKDVLRAIIALLIPVATCVSSAVKLGRDGVVQTIVAALNKHSSDSALSALCCNAIWTLTCSDENLKIATAEKAAYHVINVLQNNTTDCDVVEACCAALISLSLKEENIAVINETCCIGSLLHIVSTTRMPPAVISKTCLLLSILVEANEESAYQMLSALKPDGTEIAGIPVVVKLYAAHRDNADIVKNLVAVVAELTEYNDIASELKHMDITAKMLSEVKRRFSDRPEIKLNCDTAMQRVL